MKAAFTTRLQNCERFTEINPQVLQDSCWCTLAPWILFCACLRAQASRVGWDKSPSWTCMRSCAPLTHPRGKVQLLLKCENCGSFLGRAAVFVTVLCVSFKIEATGISSDSKESLKIRKGNFTGINLCLVNTGCFFNWKINLYRNSCWFSCTLEALLHLHVSEVRPSKLIHLFTLSL